MADSIGARARRFMGWYTPEDVEDAQEVFDAQEEVAEVTPLAHVDRPHLTSVRREPEVREARAQANDLGRIATVHPASFSDVLTVGEEFRKDVPVILNLTELNEVEARRALDFASGLAFGRHGVIERVTHRVFLLSPRGVELIGDRAGTRRSSLFNQA